MGSISHRLQQIVVNRLDRTIFFDAFFRISAGRRFRFQRAMSMKFREVAIPVQVVQGMTPCLEFLPSVHPCHGCWVILPKANSIALFPRRINREFVIP